MVNIHVCADSCHTVYVYGVKTLKVLNKTHYSITEFNHHMNDDGATSS